MVSLKHRPALTPDADALASYYTLYPIPLRPRPGILILSIIVSILGSYATLLCLGRRTGSRGWRNYALLFASAICFAAVGIWGMHFVSMISMRLQPSPNIVWYLTVSWLRWIGADVVRSRDDHGIAICTPHCCPLCVLVSGRRSRVLVLANPICGRLCRPDE
jgi:hypothetical protein